MNVQFDVEIIGEQELLHGLDELEKALESFRVPLEKAGEIAAVSIGTNIVQNIDNFAPLSPATLYQTASYRLGGPLYRRGDMMEAASDTTGSKAGSAWYIDDAMVIVGLDIESALGQIGDYLTRGNAVNDLPARPFVRLLPGDIDMINIAFLEYVEDAIAEAFRGSN